MNITLSVVLSQHLTNLVPKCFLAMALFLLSETTFSQIFQDVINRQEIKTVQIHKTGWELSQPVIFLNSADQITLSFDELTNETKNYHYSFIHCTSDWEESQLSTTEYIKGFSQNPISDYSFSYNTTFGYIHYRVDFPNDEVRFLKSGNYIVQVFEDFNDQVPVLIRRFMISEQLITIVPEIKYPVDLNYRETCQQLNIRLLNPNFKISNPIHDLKMVVKQNGRRDNMVTNLKPDFIRSDELAYEYQRQLLFYAGNEYRWLDIRSTRFLPEYMKSVTLHHPYYHAELFADQVRYGLPYFYKEDSNGKYVVSVREYDRPEVEADYLFVHFSLAAETPFSDGEVYLSGALTDWELSEKNKMKYNYPSRKYELTLLLKQGFYNYHYLLVPQNRNSMRMNLIEGDFSQTDNDYSIYVYYRTSGDIYDRLIGYSAISSLKPYTDQ